jgi:cyclopropane-fatty-acyl-phospholipid synthase
MRLLRHLFKRVVKRGTLRVYDADGLLHEFVGTPAEPVVTMRLHDKKLYYSLFLNGKMTLGEAYTDGTLTFEEDSTVHDFLSLVVQNQASVGAHPMLKAVNRINRFLKPLRQMNPVGKAQQNVAHHYDLSARLYELFLDEDRQYSCAYFCTPEDTLEVAQEKRKSLLAAKLALRPGQKVLDIGCGWGGLSLFIAQQADVEVLGVTLSREQHAIATEQAQAMGLADRVRFELIDYRHVDQKFDRIVSVGMFEHVGVSHYDEFFAKMGALLAEDGVAVLHSIGRSCPPGSPSPWIHKYIFPGAYSPALSEVFPHVENNGLWVTDLEILRIHYADTLMEWHRRFLENRDEIARLYDERFCRMWEFYLLSVETSFRHGAGMVFQMQLAHRSDTLPLTRRYILDAVGERGARAMEPEPGNP